MQNHWTQSAKFVKLTYEGWTMNTNGPSYPTPNGRDPITQFFTRNICNATLLPIFTILVMLILIAINQASPRIYLMGLC